MSDNKREKRRVKKLAKQRKKRAKASRAGGDVGPVVERTDGREGRTWPVGECFLSDNWHEQGAHVHAVVSRAKAGKAVAAFFEVDLAERGVVEARAMGGLTPDHVRGECGRLSEEAGVSMVDVAPALVAHVVHAGRQWGRDRGHQGPAGMSSALKLLEGVDPADTPFEVELGRPDGADDDDGVASEGWLSAFKRRLLG